MFYFVGSYNAWVVEAYELAAQNLAIAYSLSDDERYADKASVILDALANVYPTCTIGLRITRRKTTADASIGPNTRSHAFSSNMSTNMTGSERADPWRSHRSAGITRQQNIEENLLRNGAEYCLKMSHSHVALHNGMADYIRGVISVGVCLGISLCKMGSRWPGWCEGDDRKQHWP